MKKVIEYLKRNKKAIVCNIFIILYTIFIAILALKHENWRDETQAYLLCRDLKFTDLLKQLKYEGHPFLWYAIIYPFIKMGLGPKILNIITFVFSIITVSLILKKSKLPLITKILFVLTYPFLFEYTVVARNYSLILLLVVLICVIDHDKKKHPIIYGILLGLLANTHIIMVGFVAIITLTFYVEELLFKRKENTKKENTNILIGFLIVVFSAVLLLLQLKGAESSPVIAKERNIQSLFRLIFILPISLMDSTKLNCIIGFICMIALIMPLMIVNAKKAIIYIVSILYQIILSGYIWGKVIDHISATLIAIIIYSIWTTYDEIKDKKQKRTFNIITITIMLIISTLSTTFSYDKIKNDIKYNYSASYELAQYINENLPEDATLINLYDAQCSAVIPYTKERKYWNLITGEYYTYITWNEKRIEKATLINLYDNIKKEFSGKKVYYIQIKDVQQDEKLIDFLKTKYNIKELYSTQDAIISDETYSLYEIDL